MCMWRYFIVRLKPISTDNISIPLLLLHIAFVYCFFFIPSILRYVRWKFPILNCEPVPSDVPFIRNFQTCSEYLANISALSNIERRDFEDCHCRVNFTVPEELRSPWYMYYGLGNYFQNHRRYVNSWDVKQLRGIEGASWTPPVTVTPYGMLRTLMAHVCLLYLVDSLQTACSMVSIL